jgi:D-3-phosphoglycerate dehydrogenase / 2-oxoglutarate reductase
LLISKSKIRILVADKINLSGLKFIPGKYFSVHKKFNIPDSELLKISNDFDVLVIRTSRKLNKTFLDNCGFGLIASCSKGLDHIDLAAAAKNNIRIINSEEGNSVSAAEHTFGLLLCILKQISLSDKLVRDGKFGFYDFKRTELRGKKIGIIGMGKVGSRVAKYAEAFEMTIFANDIDKDVRKKLNNYNFKNLDFILKNADIVTLHIPLNDNNRNFISEKKLKLLNNKTILINTSRGEIIDENILIKQLKNGGLYFAGVDVFKNEPEINKSLLGLKNVILTNHIAGKTEESIQYISNDIFMQVKNYFLKK